MPGPYPLDCAYADANSAADWYLDILVQIHPDNKVKLTTEDYTGSFAKGEDNH